MTLFAEPLILGSMYVIDIAEIEAELRVLDVPVSEFLARAKINRTTWHNLRRGKYEPRQDTARRIAMAMKLLRAARAGKPGDAKKKTREAA